jgi:hypothetical protein
MSFLSRRAGSHALSFFEREITMTLMSHWCRNVLCVPRTEPHVRVAIATTYNPHFHAAHTSYRGPRTGTKVRHGRTLIRAPCLARRLLRHLL